MGKPTGPIAAALLGANAGFLTIGVLNIGAELNTNFKTFLTFFKAMGPLSGKVAIAYILGAIVFTVFLKLWKDKEFNLKTWIAITVICLFVGSFMVFPPIIEPILHIFE